MRKGAPHEVELLILIRLRIRSRWRALTAAFASGAVERLEVVLDAHPGAIFSSSVPGSVLADRHGHADMMILSL